MDTTKKILCIYFDPEQAGSLGSVRQLHREVKKIFAKVKYDQIKNILSNQDSWTLLRPVRRNFPRLKTLAQGIDEQWQADLVEMSYFSKRLQLMLLG